jgi:hypothetical protein
MMHTPPGEYPNPAGPTTSTVPNPWTKVPVALASALKLRSSFDIPAAGDEVLKMRLDSGVLATKAPLPARATGVVSALVWRVCDEKLPDGGFVVSLATTTKW